MIRTCFRKLLPSQINILGNSLKYCTNKVERGLVNMAGGLPLSDVVDKLNEFAPRALAETWDNVGLLVEPASARLINHILLTNDLTEKVLEEALNLDVGLIVSYHPPVFAPLKSITRRTWKERIVGICLENKIAVYSPHTSWDSVQNGVNDWLINALPIDSSTLRPILLGKEGNTGCGRICKLREPISIKEAVDLVKGHVKLPHVRLALAVEKNLQSVINTVAVCAGSGSSVLKDVEADLYITGEMLHHDVLNATQCGIHVILTNHSDSERGFLSEFQPKLTEMLEIVKVSVSKADRDPLQTI